MADKKNSEEKKNPLSNYAKFSGLAIQMGLLIALGAWGGQWVDEKLALGFPIFTVVLSLLGVAIAIYLLIKEFSQIK